MPKQVGACLDRRAAAIAPINHMVAVKTALLREHRWLAAELTRMFEEAREIAVAEGAEPPPPYGLEASRASLQMCLDFSADQKLTPRALHWSMTMFGIRSGRLHDHRHPRPLHDRTAGVAAVSRQAACRAGRRLAPPDDHAISASPTRCWRSRSSRSSRCSRERGSDLTIFSPRASGMAHHVGTEAVSMRMDARSPTT